MPPGTGSRGPDGPRAEPADAAVPPVAEIVRAPAGGGRSSRRRRDPARKDRILAAAADLVARHGYHAVGMADIGARAGIVGSGVYRHFSSKSAVLAVLLGKVMDDLERTAAAIVTGTADDHDAVRALVTNHVHFAIEERRLLQVYHREAHHLPEEDLRRLRRAQRHYVEEWVVVLAPLRPDLSDAELRLTVHAAIGTTQAVLFHRSGLAEDRLAELLERMGLDCLGVGAASTAATEDAASELPMT